MLQYTKIIATGKVIETMGGTDRLHNEEGFNTRINLFIIKHLYSNMKNKCDYFMIENPDSKSKRKASEDIINVIRISRQRIDRICNGNTYSMPAETSRSLAELFNISTDYFKRDSDIIRISDFTRDDWKCFFYVRYPGSVHNLKQLQNVITQTAERVQTELDNITNDQYLKNHYDKESALYHIYHYFKTHETYKPATKLETFLKHLDDLRISDWKELLHNPEQLKKCQQSLQKHSEYLDAYLKIYELKDK